MNLFIIEGNALRPNPETLQLYPFREIWAADETPKKEVAIQAFSYIGFLCSWRKENPFIGYTEEVRPQKVAKEVYGDEFYNPLEEEGGELIEDGITKFKELQEEASFSLKYFLGARKAAEKVLDFFDTLDITEKNPKSGMPLYKPYDITKAISETNKTLKDLNELQKKVQQELFESSKTRSGKEINSFER